MWSAQQAEVGGRNSGKGGRQGRGSMTVEQSVKHLVCFEFNLKWVRVSTAGTVPDAPPPPA